MTDELSIDQYPQAISDAQESGQAELANSLYVTHLELLEAQEPVELTGESLGNLGGRFASSDPRPSVEVAQSPHALQHPGVLPQGPAERQKPTDTVEKPGIPSRCFRITKMLARRGISNCFPGVKVQSNVLSAPLVTEKTP